MWFKRRTLRDVERNAKLQRQILAEASKVLRDDGEMVYATYSLEPEENKLNIDWIVRNLGLETVEIDCYGGEAPTEVFGKSWTILLDVVGEFGREKPKASLCASSKKEVEKLWLKLLLKIFAMLFDAELSLDKRFVIRKNYRHFLLNQELKDLTEKHRDWLYAGTYLGEG
ncbi:MAG: hypothetical protein QW493_03530 [Candidatus Bathyarchaeia archaeon]